MPLQPTLDQVKQRLRIDDQAGLDTQLADLIVQAHAEMLAHLDRAVYADQAALDAQDDPTGIVVTDDMINAQILLVGAHLDEAGTPEGERMHAAALRLLQRHRRMGV